MESTRETTHYTEIQQTKISRVSWAAVFGGTLVMLMTRKLQDRLWNISLDLCADERTRAISEEIMKKTIQQFV